MLTSRYKHGEQKSKSRFWHPIKKAFWDPILMYCDYRGRELIRATSTARELLKK